MSTGDITWQCSEFGCPINYSGGPDLVSAQAIQHMQESHQTEITADQVVSESTPPEA